MFWVFTVVIFTGLAANLAKAVVPDFVDENEYFSKSLLKTPSININSVCEPDEKCVPYYYCDDTDGTGIFNVRTNLEEHVTCESLQHCCETANIRKELPELEVAEKCGYRNVDGLGRFAFVKHNESQYGEFPWMMAVLRKFKSGENYLSVYTAGGSLIHPSIVLTTAHNLNNSDINTLTVRGGEWNTQTSDEMLKHVERKIQGIVYHEKFTRHNLHNDVALLFLEKPFTMMPHINTICLPQPEYQNDGKNCFASGWGKSQFGKIGSYQVFLKKVELPVVPSSTCQKMLRETRLGEDFILHDGFMCAGGQKDIDTCTGDGGSPLVCPVPGSPGYYYQAGIVSWGISCNKQDVPGVYIDVVKYMPWIEKQAEKMGFKLVA